MSASTHRRTFLKQMAEAGLLANLGGFAFLNKLPRLSAQDVRGGRNLAPVEADVEPLVRLLEETPRAQVLQAVATRIRNGTSYQELLAALMLAGVRGIQPRPVGFKFHAVLVVNSAHLASLAAHDRDRWLPLFWSVDNFKQSQATNREQGDWRMSPVAEAQLPATAHAERRFKEAMDNWDEEGADAAVASWGRNAGANAIYEAFWRYGARDFRSIGHKAIFVANSYRTLQTIGWRHAEPILRSLAYALLFHDGGNPAQGDDAADRPWRDNLRRQTRIRADWQRGQISREATTEMLAALRTADAADASEAVVAKLNANVDPASLWDAVLLGAGECLMQQPGIVGLHVVTTMNALYFAYQNSANDETRRLMLLQAAAFIPMFRGAMRGRGQVRNELRLDTLAPVQPMQTGPQAVEEVFADVSRDKMAAAQKALALLQADRRHVEPLLASARRLIFTKGSDSHDYKFSSAALEDYFHVTPAWRDRFLASSMFWLRGSGGRDNDLVRRTREALA
jgi:hypothetical protein